MSRGTSLIRDAFTGVWINKKGSKGPGGDDYRCALVFFRWGDESWSARFNNSDGMVFQGAHFGRYVVKGNKLLQEFPIGSHVHKVVTPWQIGPGGSFSLLTSNGTEYFYPSTLKAATAYASSPEVVREFLAEAREEGWVIEPVARTPDPPASAPAKGKARRP